MVDRPAGYLIVQKEDRHLADIGLGSYKGLYRTPDWSQLEYERGFDDPLVFGAYTNSFGVIPDLRSATEVLLRFAEIHPIADLEIVWTRESGCGADLPSGATNLGIDVACRAPFWSILADRPPDAFATRAASLLNSNGLFSRHDDARRYLSEYRSQHPEKADVALYLWEVYALAR